MISSCNNLKIKEFLKLKNNKKYRREKKQFTIEGVRLVFDAIKQNVNIYSLFITKNCEEKIKNSKYNLNDFKDKIIVTEKIAKKMSFVEKNQGIFAIAENFKYFNEEEIKDNEFILALFEVKDPGNLGSLFRSALSFNFKKVVIFNCCDIYNEKVIRSSMGAIFKLSFLNCSDFSIFLKNLKIKDIKTYAATLSNSAISSNKLNINSGVLILGNEANGLPSSIVDLTDSEIKIKMNRSCESLNVACAGSILMYEMNKNIN